MKNAKALSEKVIFVSNWAALQDLEKGAGGFYFKQDCIVGFTESFKQDCIAGFKEGVANELKKGDHFMIHPYAVVK